MNLNPFKWIKGEAVAAFDALVPASMRTELGTLAHAFAGNIVNDAKQLGIQAEQLAQADILVIWNTVKETMSEVIASPAFTSAATSGQIKAAISILVSKEAATVVPQMKLVGQTTLTNMVGSATAMLKSGIVSTAASVLATPAALAAVTNAATAAPAASADPPKA